MRVRVREPLLQALVAPHHRRMHRGHQANPQAPKIAVCCVACVRIGLRFYSWLKALICRISAPQNVIWVLRHHQSDMDLQDIGSPSSDYQLRRLDEALIPLLQAVTSVSDVTSALTTDLHTDMYYYRFGAFLRFTNHESAWAQAWFLHSECINTTHHGCRRRRD